MDPVADTVLAALRAAGEPLHWTVVQDRLLRSGAIDPFTTPDVRRAVLGALRSLEREGLAETTSTGVWRAAG